MELNKVHTIMVPLKKVSGAVKGRKSAFVRLSNTEIGDIIAGLNLYLEDAAGIASKDADERVLHLRNRLRKLIETEQKG